MDGHARILHRQQLSTANGEGTIDRKSWEWALPVAAAVTVAMFVIFEFPAIVNMVQVLWTLLDLAALIAWNGVIELFASL